MSRKSSKKSNRTRIMLLVHPGSAMGSADMNLGRQEARAAREFLADDIAAWKGPFFVIDGSLSDEVPGHARFHAAIESALKQAKKLGGRIWGCDDVGPHLSETLPALLRSLPQITPKTHRFELTGCWATRHGKWGCVNAAADALIALGFDTDIRDSAIYEPDEDEE